MMDISLLQTIGIDISKATLDVYAHPAGCERQFTNTAKGHRELIDWLAQWQIDRIAYEATGAYHRQLELALSDLPCVKLNPARARRFAQAVGTLAKTDKIDAVILARMAVTLQPPVRPASTPQQAMLAELISARDGLVRDKIALGCGRSGDRVVVETALARQITGTIDIYGFAADYAANGELEQDSGPFRGPAQFPWEAGFTGIPREYLELSRPALILSQSRLQCLVIQTVAQLARRQRNDGGRGSACRWPTHPLG